MRGSRDPSPEDPLPTTALLPIGVSAGAGRVAVGPEVLDLDPAEFRAWQEAGSRPSPLDDGLRARGLLAAPQDAPDIRLVPHRPVPERVSDGPGRALELALWTWSLWDPSLDAAVRRLVPGSPLLDPAVSAMTTAMAAWSATARWVLAGAAHLDTALAGRPVRSW